ncbi:MAG: hypothetical protein H7276_21980 [Caulobacter sp.]|nr:hypothetical protein [Vitreoscilla sp.]
MSIVIHCAAPIMSSSFFMRPLGLLCLLLATSPAFADELAGAKVRPSDCKPRDADSTCAMAVSGATVVTLPFVPDGVLYDGPLGGVPAMGYAYWGFDFVANESGTPSPVRDDEFINRSTVPVTITFTFQLATDHPCKVDCIPSVQFQADAGWHRIYPPLVANGTRLTMSSTFHPGQGYGWIIALRQPGNPRLTVSVPKGSTATLRSVGLAPLPAIATEIPFVTYVCDCFNGTTAPCSKGTRFSNGLLGPWSQGDDMYRRAGAFDCAVDH